MKKNMKNNKGFSLVELIVVVLIMGIIAVALAPQVMKWVGTSKESTDESNAAAIKSATQTALADYQLKGAIPSSGTAQFEINGGTGIKVTTDWTVTVNEGGTTQTIKLSDKLAEVMAGDYPATKSNTNGFTVKVEAPSGKVTVTYK